MEMQRFPNLSAEKWVETFCSVGPVYLSFLSHCSIETNDGRFLVLRAFRP